MQSHQRKKKSQPQQKLSAVKRRVFFIITVSFPFFGIILVEILLRAANYGQNIALFTTEEIAGKTYHIMNPDVKYRYFSRVEFSPNTSPDYFLVPKPKGSFRIFCLGGSTTVGYPYGYAGSFSTFLRDRLRKIFPEKTIEVINLGMTATNSFTVVDIARELVEYEPDMLLVYDGHNEFYGALGVASHETLGNIRWLTKIYLTLIHMRTFLLMRNALITLLDVLRGTPVTDVQGTMMERLAKGKYIPYVSMMYFDCLHMFQSNLEELEETAVQYNIPVLIASQVSNLRDQPPFISSTDTFRADIHYFRGRHLDSLGQKQEARFEYIKARDYDQLRFRASSDFNNAIRQAADGKYVFFVDIEGAFQRSSPDSLIGNNLILEHLHPNASGYFLMAKEYASALRKHQFLVTEHEWNSRDTIHDEQFWNERSLTEVDELCAKKRIEILTSGWPFKQEHAVPRITDGPDPISRIVSQIVTGKITWEQGHVAAAEYYHAQGDIEKAKREYRALINQTPLNVSPYLRLAQIFLQQKKYAEAESLLIQSLQVEQTPFAYKVLGSLALDGGQAHEALPHLEQAFALSQNIEDRSESGYLLALAYRRTGMTQRAIQLLEQILTVNPHYKLARDLLKRVKTSP